MKCFNDHDIRGLIRLKAKEAGGMRALARKWGFSHTFLYDVLFAKREPTVTLVRCLGLIKVSHYFPAQDEPIISKRLEELPVVRWRRRSWVSRSHVQVTRNTTLCGDVWLQAVELELVEGPPTCRRCLRTLEHNHVRWNKK